MFKVSRKIVVVALFLISAASMCFAQGQGGGQFAQIREKYKYTFQLMSMTRHISEIDKDSKYRLSPDQAKKVLAVLQPLRSKSKLTQDQAKDALKKLKPIFNLNQLNAMARIKPRPQSGQRPGGDRPGGNRPGGDRAGRPRFDPNAMKDFNPFYAKASGDSFGARRAKSTNEFFTTLQNRAKGVKQAPAKSGRAPAPKKRK